MIDRVTFRGCLKKSGSSPQSLKAAKVQQTLVRSFKKNSLLMNLCAFMPSWEQTDPVYPAHPAKKLGRNYEKI